MGLVGMMLVPVVADAHRGHRGGRGHRHGHRNGGYDSWDTPRGGGHGSRASNRLIRIAGRVEQRANHLLREVRRDVTGGRHGWGRYRGQGSRALAAARTLAHRAREFRSQVDSFWSTPYNTRSAYNALNRAYNRAERDVTGHHAYRDLQAVGRAMSRLSYFYDRGVWYSATDYDEWDAVGLAVGATIGGIAGLFEELDNN